MSSVACGCVSSGTVFANVPIGPVTSSNLLEVPEKLGLPEIVRAVAKGTDMLMSEVRARVKRPIVWEHAEARRRAFWLADQIRPDLSLGRIGSFMSLSDHTTVVHYLRQTERLLAFEDSHEEFAVLNECRSRLGLPDSYVRLRSKRVMPKSLLRSRDLKAYRGGE